MCIFNHANQVKCDFGVVQEIFSFFLPFYFDYLPVCVAVVRCLMMRTPTLVYSVSTVPSTFQFFVAFTWIDTHWFVLRFRININCSIFNIVHSLRRSGVLVVTLSATHFICILSKCVYLVIKIPNGADVVACRGRGTTRWLFIFTAVVVVGSVRFCLCRLRRQIKYTMLPTVPKTIDQQTGITGTTITTSWSSSCLSSARW